jgi:DNA ligase-associated metallophosphoesterase
VRIELGSEPVTLLPSGGAFLPEERALLVADLHLGKGAAFRAAGRAVPTGTSAETLDRLSGLVDATPPGTGLWILGDLFHSPAGVTPDLEALWRRWHAGRAGLDVTLVGGNHDAALLDVARSWGLRVRSAPVSAGSLELRHRPRARGSAPSTAYGIAGHLHPVVRLREGRRSRLRLPCFWLRGQDLILPALGAFVDGAAIRAEATDRVFVPAGDQVLEIPPAQLPSSARAG